ncbi:MAG: 2-hydroxyacid dehydrogenase [Cellulosilyticaceae bacterium]|uniref:2-hydroxyacid dehydrogenase n=1 Tax=Niameybacter sp. TaxID=2033640 RepID=UPI002FC75534
MKLVIIEPLGVKEDKLLTLAQATLGQDLEVVYYDTRTTDSEELIARGKDADIIAVSNLPLSRVVIEGCPNLKLLAVAFTGVDHIALDACRERAITVCNCCGYSNAAVTDLVFGMIVSLYRNLIPCNEVVRNHGTKDGLVGFELEGKKFGIVGTGAIGMRVAKVAAAFGCEVYAYSRTVKETPDVTYTDLDTLLKTCDIVSLHVPLTPATTHLINTEKLALIQPHAVLINTARGPVVDTKALADALSNHQIAGAGIDVFDVEPPVPSDHPLFGAPNVIVTPHIAFATVEALEKRAVIMLDNIKHYLEGSPQNII